MSEQKLSIEVEQFGAEFESGIHTNLDARDYLWGKLPPKIAALEQQVERLEAELKAIEGAKLSASLGAMGL